MPEKKENRPALLMYKGRPLVRCGNILYYGNMYEKYVVMMQVESFKEIKDQKVAGTIQIQLMATDPDLRARDRIIKKTQKDGLYNALDIGSIWLQRQMEE